MCVCLCIWVVRSFGEISATPRRAWQMRVNIRTQAHPLFFCWIASSFSFNPRYIFPYLERRCNDRGRTIFSNATRSSVRFDYFSILNLFDWITPQKITLIPRKLYHHHIIIAKKIFVVESFRQSIQKAAYFEVSFSKIGKNFIIIGMIMTSLGFFFLSIKHTMYSFSQM